MAVRRIAAVVLAIVALSLMAGPARSQTQQETGKDPNEPWPFAPSPVVLCARLAAYGLVEWPDRPMGGDRRRWECGTRFRLFPTAPGGAPTSVFTQVRGAGPVPSIFRFKVNELDPETVPDARLLVLHAIRSVARSYGQELNGAMIRLLQTMQNARSEGDCIALRVETEFSDPRRHNVWLELLPACAEPLSAVVNTQ